MDLLRATVAALLVLAVAACGPAAPKFQGSDITGINYGRDFRLNDHTGKPRTLADFRGKVVVLFFGYTQCPDVCPTTLSELAATMQKLGPDAERVQVVFVTVDPERDTADLLSRYVPAFNPASSGSTAMRRRRPLSRKNSRSSIRSNRARHPAHTASTIPRAPTSSIRKGGCGYTRATARGRRSSRTTSEFSFRSL